MRVNLVIIENCCNYSAEEQSITNNNRYDHRVQSYRIILYGRRFSFADFQFCKFFDAMMAKYTFKPTAKRKYHRDSTMSKAEIMLIMIRAVIETVNDELKNIAQVEHSRHKAFDNFIVNLLSAIAAYCCFPKKPCINVTRTIDTQLALF